ncbi:tRNA preQ1(34) S-adenosylmethionine ribosyltransferase-isomerase QueA [Tepidanaerobacter sp. GT38]|uniref:tRNA preQ1(34) S-adenosylmethionine ribosyltransferase-isomerase QueA n=1 Tax=Tepidanaerobacter sp. GT38 TaxID=2722793 RepID=UPI001F01E3F5|nr:tRNA preQ1(34) S-adenosylmethionine ribosyltransferase-isomerase QueA [Tepidanaerobacter sp. GT38]MCG1012938.1 tRNA preQ1(34) S-adenosylmethionine ribosyltransferase-isomerase QueA [Tepidanaerobacter sp. GT38]
MKLEEFDFYLPEELIAQEPIEDRSKSRLLVLNKTSGEIEHRIFEDVIYYLRPGDCLVLNNTKVIPARLIGRRKNTHGKIEMVLLKPVDVDIWEVLVKPGRRAHIGEEIVFGDGQLAAKVIDITDFGGRIVEFFHERPFQEVLHELGEMPTPPYIKKKLQDENRYQTVYAVKPGSAAAPTAGLHFTQELLEKIRQKGVSIAFITLHVGLGTFRPVTVENIQEHKMHAEYYEISHEAADLINSTKQVGGKVIAVGTTSTRTLETVADVNGIIKPGSGWTDIFIYPGYKFKAVDALITNFHLPKSTLIMLVCAFAGKEKVFRAYKEAVNEKYRFFSFGDSMLIM